jgi:hypothetical protein
VVILAMGLQMFGQIADPLAQDRDLHLGGPTILLMAAIRLNDLSFPLRRQWHAASLLSAASVAHTSLVLEIA